MLYILYKMYARMYILRAYVRCYCTRCTVTRDTVHVVHMAHIVHDALLCADALVWPFSPAADADELGLTPPRGITRCYCPPENLAVRDALQVERLLGRRPRGVA